MHGETTHRPRALRTLWVLLALILVTVALEAEIVRRYHRPTDLIQRVEEYEKAAPDLGPHVVAFGTCLGEVLTPSLVEKGWQAGIGVQNLASRASTSVDWYLIFKRRMTHAPGLKAVLLAFGGDDLKLGANPSESQVLDLAGWKDVPDLIGTSCNSLNCAMEVLLRKAWPGYRYRAYLSLGFWNRVGTGMPGFARPAGKLNPGTGNVDGGQVVTQLDAPVAPDLMGGAKGSRPAGPPQVKKPLEPQKTAVADLGWHEESTWFRKDADPYVWVKKLLSEARARKVKVLLVALPMHPNWPGGTPGWSVPETRAEITAMADQYGAEVLDPGTIPGLTERHFVNDSHVNIDGARIVAAGLGQALGRRFPPGAPGL